MNEEDDELTPEEIADIQQTQQDHNEIMFVLKLLLNDYVVDDILFVAEDLKEIYDNQFICIDCNVSVMDKHEFFLVHPQLEKEVDLHEGHRLCVECFEERLGRELTAFDFTSEMITDTDLDHSPLLKKRLISGLEDALG